MKKTLEWGENLNSAREDHESSDKLSACMSILKSQVKGEERISIAK